MDVLNWAFTEPEEGIELLKEYQGELEKEKEGVAQKIRELIYLTTLIFLYIFACLLQL